MNAMKNNIIYVIEVNPRAIRIVKNKKLNYTSLQEIFKNK